jgi:aspartate racemase
MKTIGIVGGLGPESTVDYYQRIIRVYRERTGDGSYPPMVINSLNLQKMVGFADAGVWTSVAAYLREAFEQLARAGADFALISANTPHVVFDEVRRGSPIPLISIVEATCDAAQKRGMKKLGLFGTRFTMQGRFYPDVLSRGGISLAVPNAGEQTYIHEHYMGELVKGVFLPETRQRLVEIAHALKQREGVEGLILGGTELPLILNESDLPELSLLDTTRIHVEAAVERIVG